MRSPSFMQRVARVCELLVLALLVGIFLWPGIRPGQIFCTPDTGMSDLLHHNIANEALLGRSLRRLTLPFWTRDSGPGLPSLAEGQIGALYPVNLVLHGVFPLAIAFNLNIFFHFLLAAVTARYYARSLGLSRPAAILVGTVFALCGQLVVHLKHINLVATAAWMPLVLALIESHLQERSRQGWSVAMSFTVAMLILAGHHQTAYDTLLVAAMYASVPIALGASGRHWTFTVRRVWTLGLAVALGVALAAPQILPTLELVKESERAGGLSTTDASSSIYRWRDLILFLVPYRFGDPSTRTYAPDAGSEDHRTAPFWENTAYIGIIPLILALLSPIVAHSMRSPGLPSTRVWPLLALSVVCLFLALGPATPVWWIFRLVVPGFRYFRLPMRFLVFADLTLAVLAGVCLDLMLVRTSTNRRRTVMAIVWGLTVADLFNFGFRHNPHVDSARLLAKPELVQRLSRETQPYRVLPLGGSLAWESAFTEAGGWNGSQEPFFRTRNIPGYRVNLLYGIPSWAGYGPLQPRRSKLFDEVAQTVPKRFLVAMGIMNVRFVVAAYPLDEGDLRPLGKLPGPAYLYDNPHAFSRAFVTSACRFVRTLEEARRVMSDPMHDVHEVVVEDPDHSIEPPVSGTLPVTSAIAVASSDTEVAFLVRAPRNGIFFLSELAYPGWTAELDGRSVPLCPANIAGRAIGLPSGVHRVTFRYRCAPFLVGLWVSVLALGVLGALAVAGRHPYSWGRGSTLTPRHCVEQGHSGLRIDQ